VGGGKCRENPDTQYWGRDLHSGKGEAMKKSDLRDRTKAFAGSVVRLYCELPRKRSEVQVIAHQLLRSGTSVAANYREASRARSDAEFVSKIEQCTQEADESCMWMELLRDDCGIVSERLQGLLTESNELISIFVSMSRKVKAKRSRA
jgi:four helix bundle protein